MEERYSRNFPTLSEADMEKIRSSHVLVVGCGGLGGYIIEYLTRLGIGALTVVDGDVFSESNLNRQLLSTMENLGVSKALCAERRIKEIDPSVQVTAVNAFLDENNAGELMKDVCLIFDAVDNASARLILEDAAAKKGLTILHGAIQGKTIQAIAVAPGSGTLHALYGRKNASFGKSVLPMTAALCAAIQVNAGIEILCQKETPLQKNLLSGSVSTCEFDLIPFSN